MKYFIKTFGCQMNVSDSERIASFLEEAGLFAAEKMQAADLVIFNTCGIKQTAENRAYSLINNLRKGNGTSTKIALTGCLADRADVQKRMRDKVDLFFPIKDISKFGDWIIENCELKIPTQKNNLLNQEEISYLSIQPKNNNQYQAYVPIMTGCNNFCTYCVVPYARGREVSRPAQEIITEVKNLISKNYKHIILLGQNVNSYESKIPKVGKSSKLEVAVDFPKLLKKINALPGKFWISFVSSHPKDMSDELIETVARCKKVCEWIHLPVQAGDDKILAKMNRKYTQKHYLGRISKIKKTFLKIRGKSVPISISSDIIVGFPGETNKQFSQSAEVMKKAKFDMVFFGQFSPRPGTVAWKMKDNVSQKEKTRRENSLNELLKKTTLANNKKYVGKKLEILIEQEKAGAYFGKTRTQKNVRLFTRKKLPLGTFVEAKITKANVWNLEGEVK